MASGLCVRFDNESLNMREVVVREYSDDESIVDIHYFDHQVSF